MVHSANRLERALSLFVEHREQGGDWLRLLQDNPDLAELLTSLAEEPMAEAGHGERLGGFELLGEVGRGGLGRVYEARDPTLGRRVAIKVLHPESASDPVALARFRREAQLMARLDHPAIVRVLGVGEDEGRHWVAMEFVEGSLAREIEALAAVGGHRGDSLRRCVEAVAAAAAGLQVAHEAGILHRDVKPANILLRSDGSAALGDFGIARDAADLALTQTGVLVGSPHYLAPERVLGRGEADARSDVFALGATLYECATLRRAFPGTTTAVVLQSVAAAEPVDPRRLSPGVPLDLAAIIGCALEKDPAARYATAGAFADDLRAFLELRPVVARRPSLLRRTARRVRRQPLAAVAVVLLAVALVAFGWIALRWPELQAAAALDRTSRYDTATLLGFQARARGDLAGSRRQFAAAMALQPERAEACLGMALLECREHGPAAGLRVLDERPPGRVVEDDALGWCRSWLLDREHRDAEAQALRASLAAPTSADGLWLHAMGELEFAGAAAQQRSLAELSMAVRIAPRRNLVLLGQWASAVISYGNEAQRREAAETLQLLFPDEPYALQLAGVALIKADPAQAVTLLQKALDLGLTDPLGQGNLGIALVLAGRRAEGLPRIRAAVQAPGLDAPHRAQLITTVGVAGDPDGADRLGEEWLAEAPDEPLALRCAGRAASRRGDHETALQRLAKARAGLPDDPDIGCDLARALLGADDPAAATTLLDTLVAAHPQHQELHLLRVVAAEDSGDQAAGIAELQRWLALRPDDGEAWGYLAERLLAHGTAADLPAALQAAERSDILTGGTDADARELRAKVHDRLGETGAAARLRKQRGSGH